MNLSLRRCISLCLCFCLLVNIAVAIRAEITETLSAAPVTNAINAQTPIIGLFICSTLPLKLVSEYFIDYAGIPQPVETPRKKDAARKADTSSSVAIVQNQKTAEDYLDGRCPDQYPSRCSVVAMVQVPQACCRSGQHGAHATNMLLWFILLCMVLLPRAGTNDYLAVLCRRI